MASNPSRTSTWLVSQARRASRMSIPLKSQIFRFRISSSSSVRTTRATPASSSSRPSGAARSSMIHSDALSVSITTVSESRRILHMRSTSVSANTAREAPSRLRVSAASRETSRLFAAFSQASTRAGEPAPRLASPSAISRATAPNPPATAVVTSRVSGEEIAFTTGCEAPIGRLSS